MTGIEPDGIDQLWRDGLAHTPTAPATEAPARVQAAVTRRSRRRRAARGLGAVLVVIVVVGAIATLPRSHKVDVSTRGPVTNVVLDDGRDNTLTIRRPGRPVTGGPPTIRVPAGRVRFTIHYFGTHTLVLDGVPAFRAPGPTDGKPLTATTTVTLRPGRYRLHCTIKGHTIAGEVAWVVVR